MTVTLPISHIRRALRACSTDTTRAGLAQILVEPTRCVATDGYRLHTIDHPEGVTGPTDPLRVCRAALDAALALARTWGAAEIQISRGYGDAATLGLPGVSGLSITAPPRGTYPPYQGVIPTKPAQHHALQTRQAWLDALQAAVLACADQPLGATTVQLGDGGPCVNPAYLADAIKDASPDRRGPEVEIAWGGELDPIRVTAPGFSGVIMPMRRGAGTVGVVSLGEP